MRMSGHATGGEFFKSNSQQLDSEPENNLDYSSSECDQSDADVPDVNGQSSGSYQFPFEGETAHHFFKFGGGKESDISEMTLPTINQMLIKSSNANVSRNLQLAGHTGVRYDDVANVSNKFMRDTSVTNIAPEEKQSILSKRSPRLDSTSDIRKDGNSSDTEVRRVPEISGKANAAGVKVANVPGSQASIPSRKRGGASADKEHKRMKRLLRNRVSAQQARERKKAYLCELELKSKELERTNAELLERVSTLERENFMLRQIVKNTTLKNADVH